MRDENWRMGRILTAYAYTLLRLCREGCPASEMLARAHSMLVAIIRREQALEERRKVTRLEELVNANERKVGF